jgi:Glutamine amidotransferase domain
MCGLSGYIGLNVESEDKLMLILGLGDGIDNRGGHACGYAAADADGDFRYARKSGTWIRSRVRFVEGAAAHMCMMHARWATCGNREDPMNAHPFAIRRGGRVVMWGAHNGMVPDAFKSAKDHGREVAVDSQEIFELLADKDYEGIRSLSGYGVVTWIDTNYRDRIHLCRLSSNSDICVVSVKGGGVVWASTWKILKDALKVADLEVEREFKIDEIGRVYRISADGVRKTKLGDIKVGYRARGGRAAAASYSSGEGAKANDAEVDEEALVETKNPGESEHNYTSGSYSPYMYSQHNQHSSSSSTSTSSPTSSCGATTPTPSAWKKSEGKKEEYTDLEDYYRGMGWCD